MTLRPAGEEGSDDVVAVPVEVVPGPVVMRRRPRVCVPSGYLHIAEGNQPAEYIAALEGATVQKLGYSAAPWRIVTTDGREVTHSIVFDHPNLGKMALQEAGFRIKRDAVAALNELQARVAEGSSQRQCGSDQQPPQSPGASTPPTASGESTRPASESPPAPSSPRQSTPGPSLHRLSGGGPAGLDGLGEVTGDARPGGRGAAVVDVEADGEFVVFHVLSKPCFQGPVNIVSSDERPMTPEEVVWVRAQRVTEEDPEPCRVPGVAEGTCAYAAPDGADGCGVRCRYSPLHNDGSPDAR